MNANVVDAVVQCWGKKSSTTGVNCSALNNPTSKLVSIKVLSLSSWVGKAILCSIQVHMSRTFKIGL